MLEILPKLTGFKLDLHEAVAISSDKQNFDYARAQKWMMAHRPFALQVSIAYIIVVFSLKKWMAGREAFKINGPLKVWNAIIGGISIMCAVGMTRDFFSTLINKGISASVCSSGLDFFTGDTGYYVWIYHMIRLFEFGDTAFIVMVRGGRRRDLIPVKVNSIRGKLDCAPSGGKYSYPTMSTWTRCGIYINSVVHGFMYTYYLLRSMKVPVPGIFARSLTIFQIVQFIVIVYSVVHTTVLAYVMKMPCECSVGVLVFGWAVDFSYLILFSIFYKNKYNKKEEKEESKKIE